MKLFIKWVCAFDAVAIFLPCHDVRLINVSAIYGNQREFTYHISHNSSMILRAPSSIGNVLWTRSHCYFCFKPSKRTHRYTYSKLSPSCIQELCVSPILTKNYHCWFSCSWRKKWKMSCRCFCSCLRAWEQRTHNFMKIGHLSFRFSLYSHLNFLSSNNVSRSRAPSPQWQNDHEQISWSWLELEKLIKVWQFRAIIGFVN